MIGPQIGKLYEANSIKWSLFLLRVGVFNVTLACILDKFIDSCYVTKILERFKYLGGVGEQKVIILGAFEMLIILANLAGTWKS